MDNESKLEQYVLLAKGARGRALQDLIQRVTSEPGIFSFGELLSLTSVKDLCNTEFAPAYAVLELFCYGTLADYRASPERYLQLTDIQLLKLKQLTVVSIAASAKVVQYEELMRELDIQGLRELEDLIITGCFYSKLLKGSLDQKQRCLIVEEVVGRDVRAEEVPAIVEGLSAWLDRAQRMLVTIEEKIAFSQQAAAAAAAKVEEQSQQRKALEAEVEVEDAKHQQKIAQDTRGSQGALVDEPGQMLDFSDERMASTVHGRPKRRR